MWLVVGVAYCATGATPATGALAATAGAAAVVAGESAFGGNGISGTPPPLARLTHFEIASA